MTSPDARSRQEHERDFWDHHVIPLDYCLEEYRRGPDPNTAVLLDALEPLSGQEVLDFACGPGVMSAWLADRGGRVTGIDLSQGAIERAQELQSALGFEATFLAQDAGTRGGPGGHRFRRIAGRYALHHVDPAVVGPQLGACLAEDGRSAFLETMASNSALRLSRSHMVGRFGIRRLGTLDERPLTSADVDVLAAALGRPSVRVGQMAFLRILDRQVLRFRWPLASRLLARTDDLLGSWDRLRFLSYKQVLVFDRGR